MGVDEVEPERVHAEINASALTGKELSSATREVLRVYDLESSYEDDPLAAVRALHERAVQEPARVLTFALAETCFLAAKAQEGDGFHAPPRAYTSDAPRTGLPTSDWYLAAVVYAYAYLLGQEAPAPPNPYDRRFRWACDLYNRGLQGAFSSKDKKSFELQEGTRTLPVGSLRVSVDRGEFPWGEDRIDTFLLADRFLVEGLNLRLRDSGLGVPLIGLRSDAHLNPQRVQQDVAQVPATAFLRFNGTLRDLANGIDAGLELYSGYDASNLVVAGEQVPLETDRSVMLAYALDRPAIWKFSVRGLFSSGEATGENSLILVQPYQPGRVPIVFIHGTASSPAYWADLFNTLWGDPELRRHAQFWFFKYATGNPIVYSAAELRDALNEAVQELDPAGTDPALRNMVLIGHSQGGLLAKLIVVDGSVSWFEDITGLTLEDFQLDPDERALVERCLEFDPFPCVKRVIFVCTPHGGSFLSSKWYGRLAASLISLPSAVEEVGSKFLKDEARLPKELRGKHFTSLENMDPENPMLKRLASEPIAPGVTYNSIIAIGDADANDADAVAGADDGVVQYPCAHIEGAESEALVPEGHSCQSHPITIQEVRRILREHVRSSP